MPIYLKGNNAPDIFSCHQSCKLYWGIVLDIKDKISNYIQHKEKKTKCSAAIFRTLE